MRSFLAALVLLLAGVVGTVALTSYVANRTVLDPDHTGKLLSSVVRQPELRHRLLTEAVPGYDSLPPELRAGVNRVAEDPRFDAAVRKLKISDNGTVRLGPLRSHLEQQLVAAGQPQLAAGLEQLGGATAVKLPTSVVDRYSSVRDTSHKLQTRGGLLAVALLAVAVLVARNRRVAVGAAGVVVLLSCGATYVLWSAGPSVAAPFTTSTWMAAVATATQSYDDSVRGALLPVVVVGAALVLLSLVLPRRRPSR